MAVGKRSGTTGSERVDKRNDVCDPFRIIDRCLQFTGGIASLNHRLMSVKPTA